jgi:hypothetical protein
VALVLRKQWSQVLVAMHKASSDLSRLRSNLKSLHVVAQLDAQNAAVGGADASREDAKERELLTRMNQIDVYLCTANMLYASHSLRVLILPPMYFCDILRRYAQACVAYSGKESMPSVQQQRWFAASYVFHP